MRVAGHGSLSRMRIGVVGVLLLGSGQRESRPRACGRSENAKAYAPSADLACNPSFSVLQEAEAAASKPKAAKADKPKSAAKAAKKASKENTKPKAAAASGPVGVAQQQKKKKAAAAAAAPAEKKKAAGSGGDGDDSSSESDGGGAARWGMVRTADQAAVGVEEEGEEGGIAVAKKQRTDEPGKESAAASD